MKKWLLIFSTIVIVTACKKDKTLDPAVARILNALHRIDFPYYSDDEGGNLVSS